MNKEENIIEYYGTLYRLRDIIWPANWDYYFYEYKNKTMILYNVRSFSSPPIKVSIYLPFNFDGVKIKLENWNNNN